MYVRCFDPVNSNNVRMRLSQTFQVITSQLDFVVLQFLLPKSSDIIQTGCVLVLLVVLSAVLLLVQYRPSQSEIIVVLGFLFFSI